MSGWKKLAAASAASDPVNVETIFSSTLYRATDNGNATFVQSGTDLLTNGGMIWFKCRSSAFNHALCDTVTGIQNNLVPNRTDALDTNGDSLGRRVCDSVQTNGFTYGTGHTGSNGTSGGEYCAWSFAKQPKFFTCISYTGDGTSGRSISHDLDCDVGMVMIKNLTRASDWHIWHRGLSGTNYGIALNQTYSEFTNGGILTATPTSTTVTIKNPGYDGAGTNNNGDSYVMYLFAHNNNNGTFGNTLDKDIIKCGSFTGNGSESNGTVVDLDFEPQWVWIKARTSGQAGVMFDNMRGVSSAEQDQVLYPMYNSAEGNPQSFIAFRPDGFQLQTDNYEANGSGVGYVYMAIRRPMAEAQTGAEVFKATYGNASGSQPPGWSSPTGFVVDASFDMNFGGGATDDITWGARLVQNRYTDQIDNNSGNFWYSWDGQNYDHQNGFMDSSNGTGDLGYMWQRKAGGFDVATFRGTGSNMTIPHNLAGEVGMMWLTRMDATRLTFVYARPLGNQGRMRLNDGYQAETSENIWNSTHPTASNFYVHADYAASGSENMVMLFGNLDGVSKVGTFTGNGTNQNIDCGFSNGIRLLMIKKTNSSGEWYWWDEANLGASGDPFWYIKNQAGLIFNQDTIDAYSAGFNVKFNTSQSINTNGDTYLFYAVAA